MRSVGRYYQRLTLCIAVLVFITELQQVASSTFNALTRSIPALSLKRKSHQKAIEVSTKLKKLPTHVGFFYGIRDDLLTTAPKKPKPRLSQVMSETLEELREMREEMTALRREIQRMKRDTGVEQDEDETKESETGITGLVHRRMRQREFDKIGMEVEKWAEKMLFEEEGKAEYGWKEVSCHKMFRKKFNRDKTIRCYLKVSEMFVTCNIIILAIGLTHSCMWLSLNDWRVPHTVDGRLAGSTFQTK